MQKKQMVLTPVGLHKDTAVHAFDVTKACDAQNIRFTSTGEELSEGCISNEKSNSKTFILPRNIDNKEYNIEGTVLGIHVLQDFVIIFSHLEDNLDAIYKIKYANEDQFLRNKGCGVITGNFNFNTSYPIECLGIIENNNIKRVYWVDGLNQPRSINIETAFKKDNDGNVNNPENKVASTIFDFKPDLYTWLLVNIKIEKDEVGGVFPAGVIQYVVTSISENDQESSVVYQSPLYYTSENGRGLSGEQISNNSFKITIEAIPTDKKFKVYRIVYTSINNFSVYDLGNYNVGENSESYKPSIAVENGPCDIPSYNPINGWNVGGYSGSGEDLLDTLIFSFKEGYNGWWVVNTDESEKINTITLLDGYSFSSREEGDNSGIDRIAVYTGRGTGSLYRDIKKVIFWSNFNTGLEFDNIVNPITNDIDSNLDIEKLGLSPQFPEEEYSKYNITILDTGKEGTVVDNTYLKFLNTEPISPYTLCQKDNTLFFGNYKLLLNNFTDKFKSDIKNNSTKQFFSEDCATKSDNIEDLNNQYYFLSTLENNSSENTYFHYGELYRFGVQFLHKTGYWSEVVYIGDEKNEVRVVPNKYNDALYSRPLFKVSIPAEYLPQDEGYIGARLVVVYPESYNRSVLYQGIFFPTVFNVEDRLDNFPYAQPDWFSRYEYFKSIDSNPSNESLAAWMNSKQGQPLFNKVGEFIPGGKELNSELQYEGYLVNTNVDDYNESLSARKSLIAKRHSGFCIDKNIMTFYSPELTFDDQSLNTKLNDAKIRIIGYVVPKTNFSKIDITSSNIFDTIDGGFKELNIEDSSYGFSGVGGNSWYISDKQLTTHALWVDGIAKKEKEDTPSIKDDKYRELLGFPIYPWQRSGSLNNMNSTSEATRKSILNKKKLSNMKVCLSPTYLDDYIDIENTSNIEICDAEFAEDSTIIKLDLGLDDEVVYKSNINKILLASMDSSSAEDSPEHYGEWVHFTNQQDTPADTAASIETIEKLQNITGPYQKLTGGTVDLIHRYSKDPIKMSYKTTRHLVFGLKHTKELMSDSVSETRYYKMSVPLFPTLGEKQEIHATEGYIWDKPGQITYYNTGDSIFNGPPILDSKVYYPVGEVYRDVVNPFNGTSKEILSTHSWIPCSDTILFSEVKNNLLEVKANRGDTYFQRFDCLKTYARTPEDENQIVDIVSFPCETRINIDGRYDKNRGLKDNTNISPQNFNLLNDVYSQKENYFTYSYLNAADVKGTTFNNQILWSKTKVSGEKIDTWGSISPVNSMDLDGQKGSVNALRTYKNNIYCFQDCGISVIDFNSRVQIPTSDGVPIEISNSGKVTGKMYLSDKYGCQNKWSMAETNNGIYFADGYNKGIVLFNGKDTLDLSKSLFVNSAFSDLNLYKKWTPDWPYSIRTHSIRTHSIRTHYNSIDQDVYFTTEDFCLSYNEKAQSFTSFYSYEKVPYAFNIKGNYYQLKNNNLWRLHGGSDYNNFFGVDKDFSVSVVANADYLMDKVFENVELRTDDITSFDIGNTTTDTKPFSELITENEYQKAVRDTSKLKKKFRVWRWPIGKDSNRDRIRNMWSKITIKGNKDYKKRLKLSSILVDYYI